MKLCQRSLMWKLGYGDAYFHYQQDTETVILSCESDKVSSITDDSDTREEYHQDHMSFGII
jgi:hypothetical protein